MSIGVAILGGGIFAREEHKPAIEAAKTLTLKAIYSRSLKSAKSLETGPDVEIYSDDSDSGKSLDDLLARSDIQAVTIALPIKNQQDYVRKALLAGKHVLSEKPIAENLKDAQELLKWYEAEILPKGVTWAIAENYRYLASLNKLADARKSMGRTLTFRIRQHALIEGGKYFETEWRKVPTHQGGFLLDGGVHFTAGMRLLLGKDDSIVSLTAKTAQLQEHLPPVDTIEAALKTKNGGVGTFSLSFGTTDRGVDYVVGCEKGTIGWKRDKMAIDGKEENTADERTGVPPEVRKWAEAIVSGKPDERQSPQEALADLEILEACLRSGEQGGAPIELKLQEW